MQPDSYVATSVAKTLMARLTRTHERRRISVFSGPPGIGKSTAIERFRAERPDQVAVVELEPGPRSGHKAMGALRYAVDAIAQITPEIFHGAMSGHRETNLVMFRSIFFGLVCDWANVTPLSVRRHGLDPRDVPPLTIIFDEAQHLAREGIEALRTLNSDRGTYAPIPIGLIFVGNNEFQLRADKNTGQSVLTEAVADRLLYHETFEYQDVRDADLALYFEAEGLTDPNALSLALRYFATDRTNRSFRRAHDFLDELREQAADAPICADTIRTVLCLT